MKRQIKQISLALGVYPIARSWYRALNPKIVGAIRRQTPFYREFLRSGDLCFDVGTNVGQTTQALLTAEARVVAIEPNPSCLGTLHQQFGRYPGFTLVPKAIAEQSSTVRLFTDGPASTASLQPDWPALRSTAYVDVEATTLDQLIQQYSRPTTPFKVVKQPDKLFYSND